MLKIIKYVIYDILRNKILLFFTLFLALMAFSLFMMQDDPSKSLISLMSIVLIIVPLVSMIFTTIYFYNSYEFIELLVSQPISRKAIIMGEYFGVAGSWVLSISLSLGIPVALYSANATGLILLLSSIALSVSFVSLAFLVSVLTRDKSRGIGISLIVWFFFSVIYDSLILGILFFFSEYPLEKAVLAMASFNPIDMARILILMKMDISALMGLTGAVYKKFFGSGFGMIFSTLVMLLWILIPVVFAQKIFKNKNL
ncbi:MAG: ABC transporter permease subunit [Flavobacteriales bacterium]|nr:ABC transporter permease subunit [Flavobacteriales bacterium]